MDIVSRAKNMITSPKTEWPIIEGEITDVAGLYTSYIVPLAAIPPLAGLIGRSLLFPRVGMGFGIGLVAAVVAYVLGLIGVYVVAFIAAKLAPMFGGRDDLIRGLKLIAFGSTAAWVGGIFRLIPFLGILSLLASLYSIYIIYTGVTPMMGVPQDRAIGYTVAVIVAAVVVFIVIGLIVGGIVGAGIMAGGTMM
jgi:Yip1 domain